MTNDERNPNDEAEVCAGKTENIDPPGAHSSLGLGHSLVLSHSSLVIFLILAFYALDQLTKLLIVRRFEFDSIHPVIDGFFYLVHFGNTGAAFSMFQNGNAFFIALSSVALVILTLLFARGAFADRWMRIGFALLIAGILGNLTDRLIHKHVVDFLLFDLHVPFANPWPAFNVADSCICIATAMLVLQSFRHPSPAPK